MTRRWQITSLTLLMLGFASVLLSGCSEETPTLAPAIPTIEEAKLAASEIPITALLRNPYSFEDELIRVTGLYHPLPIMVCNNDPHLSPATWTLSDGVYEVPAAGYDAVLRQLGEPDVPLLVEGRWRFWDGPVGCGRRAPNEELWYIDVSRIISPNPITLAALPSDDGILTEEAQPSEGSSDQPAEEAVPEPPTSVSTIIPTASMAPSAAVENPIPSATPLPTETASPSPTPSETPSPTATEFELNTATPGAEPTEEAATPTPSLTPTSGPTSTQSAPAGGGALDYERIARTEIVADAVHSWDFDAIEDDVISVSVGPAPGLDLAMELLDPEGTTIAVTNDWSSGQGESIDQVYIEDSGSYTVRVRSVRGTSGEYSLVLTNEDSEAFLVFKEYLSYGSLGTGAVPELTDHLWSFKASSGDQVSVRVDPGTSSDLVLFLIAPDSTELLFVDDTAQGESEQITNFVISVSGTYSIRIGELEFQEAAYTVTLNGS